MTRKERLQSGPESSRGYGYRLDSGYIVTRGRMAVLVTTPDHLDPEAGSTDAIWQRAVAEGTHISKDGVWNALHSFAMRGLVNQAYHPRPDRSSGGKMAIYWRTDLGRRTVEAVLDRTPDVEDLDPDALHDRRPASQTFREALRLAGISQEDLPQLRPRERQRFESLWTVLMYRACRGRGTPIAHTEMLEHGDPRQYDLYSTARVDLATQDP